MKPTGGNNDNVPTNTNGGNIMDDTTSLFELMITMRDAEHAWMRFDDIADEIKRRVEDTLYDVEVKIPRTRYWRTTSACFDDNMNERRAQARRCGQHMRFRDHETNRIVIGYNPEGGA